MARRFAQETRVDVDRTRNELDALLIKHKATQRVFAADDEHAEVVVQFKIGERFVKLRVRQRPPKLPRNGVPAERPRGWPGWTAEKRAAWVEAQARQYARSAWRRMLLIVKAKLELIAEGESTIEREFLPDILLPDGRVVLDALRDELRQAYLSGKTPPLLLGPVVTSKP